MDTTKTYIRQGMGAVRAYLYGNADLPEFVRQVFGAEVIERADYDDKSAHVEMRIDDSILVIEAGVTHETATRASVYPLQVQTIASRGPAMTAKSAQFQYFVAIAKIGAGPLARQAFDVEIDLEGNAVRAQSVDELTQTIPLVSGENGDNYAIYVGIVLTPEELKFNRADSSSTIVAPASP